MFSLCSPLRGRGGYPILPTGEYPIPGLDQKVLHLRSGQGGVPHPRSGWGCPHPADGGGEGGTPIQDQERGRGWSSPSRNGWGTLIETGWVTPCLDWMGYTSPHQETDQHSEHLLRGGRYASCVHAGGLSCGCMLGCLFVPTYKISKVSSHLKNYKTKTCFSPFWATSIFLFKLRPFFSNFRLNIFFK